MARRKVTMLEAFQRSARESAERAAAERRRVIADREKEVRRAETARVAQEFSSRLSQRAGDSMGSLLAGIRSAAESPAAETPAAESPATGSTAADPPAAETLEAGAARGGPELPAFDRARQPDLPDVSSLVAGEMAPTAEPSQEPSSVEPAAAESSSVGSPSEQESDAPDQDEAALEPTLSPDSPELDEEAIAALESEVFELPMSARAFALFSLAAMIAVFMIGFSLGSRNPSGADPVGDSGFVRAGYDSLAAPTQQAPQDPRQDVLPAPLTDRPADARLSAAATAAEAAAEAVPGEAPDRASSALTREDELFRDRQMKFTILAITYSGTEAHAKLAMETYDYLYSQGFPVIHPIEKDSRLFLFVGAAETMEDLEKLQQELRELSADRNSEKRPFRSAYLVNIDPYR